MFTTCTDSRPRTRTPPITNQIILPHMALRMHVHFIMCACKEYEYECIHWLIFDCSRFHKTLNLAQKQYYSPARAEVLHSKSLIRSKYLGLVVIFQYNRYKGPIAAKFQKLSEEHSTMFINNGNTGSHSHFQAHLLVWSLSSVVIVTFQFLVLSLWSLFEFWRIGLHYICTTWSTVHTVVFDST